MSQNLPVIESSALQTLLSPTLVIFRDRLLANLDKMLVMAGHPARLRPHCKTHKMEQIVRLWVERGVTKHKAATIAECEMLAAAGGIAGEVATEAKTRIMATTTNTSSRVKAVRRLTERELRCRIMKLLQG